MTKEILKLSATFLGLYDVVSYLNNTDNSTPSESTQNKIDELLIYMNYVIREITKEYYPLSYSETIASNSQCEIPFTSFTKNPIAIKKVELNNHSETFNIYPTFIKVGNPDTLYIISYNYTPEVINTFNQASNLPLGLEPFIICYGIASEYAMSKLLYEEANMWESKFRNALQSIKFKVQERNFLARKLK